jgi:hypothetical protein
MKAGASRPRLSRPEHNPILRAADLKSRRFGQATDDTYCRRRNLALQPLPPDGMDHQFHLNALPKRRVTNSVEADWRPYPFAFRRRIDVRVSGWPRAIGKRRESLLRRLAGGPWAARLRTNRQQPTGSVAAMWSPVLVLTLLIALSPARLGITLLLISRPRPVQNLLAYWVGGLTGSIPAVAVPMTLLHRTPMLKSFADNLATSSTVRHIQIGMGVLALSIAALMTVRSLTRARQRAHRPTPGGNTATLVLDSNTPPAISQLLDRTQDPPTEAGSAIRRLLGRAHNAWENGSLWVASVIGFVNMPAPDVLLFVLAIIVTSGASIGTQVSAAIAFVVGILAVVEITLVSYLAAPAQTQAVLRLLHDWVLAHRRQILVAIFAVGGVSLVAHGMGSI